MAKQKDDATFRRRRKRQAFTQISNAFLEDDNISYKSKGLMAYMLSRPTENWIIYLQDLINHSKDGESAVKSALRELENNRYLKRWQGRNSNGTFGAYHYEFDDEKLEEFDDDESIDEIPKKELNKQDLASDLPGSDFPLADNPDAEKPPADNRTLNNNKDNNKKKNNTESKQDNNNSRDIEDSSESGCSGNSVNFSGKKHIPDYISKYDINTQGYSFLTNEFLHGIVSLFPEMTDIEKAIKNAITTTLLADAKDSKAYFKGVYKKFDEQGKYRSVKIQKEKEVNSEEVVNNLLKEHKQVIETEIAKLKEAHPASEKIKSNILRNYQLTYKGCKYPKFKGFIDELNSMTLEAFSGSKHYKTYLLDKMNSDKKDFKRFSYEQGYIVEPDPQREDNFILKCKIQNQAG